MTLIQTRNLRLFAASAAMVALASLAACGPKSEETPAPSESATPAPAPSDSGVGFGPAPATPPASGASSGM
jgi:predicted small lipoprotein YifL